MAARKRSRSKAVVKAKAGRPSAYCDEYARMAYRHCLLGATNAELARLFGVAEATIANWLNEHQPFLDAVKRGRDEADGHVAKALYHRALGYSHKAVKILTVADGNGAGSHIEQVPYVERYPPDTGAAMAWLKNRQPEKWRDRQGKELVVTSQDAAAFFDCVNSAVVELMGPEAAAKIKQRAIQLAEQRK